MLFVHVAVQLVRLLCCVAVCSCCGVMLFVVICCCRGMLFIADACSSLSLRVVGCVVVRCCLLFVC